ncbi:MAG: hypothetical protein WCT19_03175 [Candidatus Paceibacterota bacterium]|jgi:hypothetical protein
MSNYKGVIIKESLEDKSLLKQIRIISTKVEKVTKKHRSREKQWTLHTIEIEEDKADDIAGQISLSIKDKWYADFKNKTHHFIIFKNKVFFIDRTSLEQYNEAKQYGISLGIPEYQVDFHPEVK